jgi:hypothetical protein
MFLEKPKSNELIVASEFEIKLTTKFEELYFN